MVVDLGMMGQDFETGFAHVVECEIGGRGAPCAKKSKALYCYKSVTLFFTQGSFSMRYEITSV